MLSSQSYEDEVVADSQDEDEGGDSSCVALNPTSASPANGSEGGAQEGRKEHSSIQTFNYTTAPPPGQPIAEVSRISSFTLDGPSKSSNISPFTRPETESMDSMPNKPQPKPRPAYKAASSIPEDHQSVGAMSLPGIVTMGDDAGPSSMQFGHNESSAVGIAERAKTRVRTASQRPAASTTAAAVSKPKPKRLPIPAPATTEVLEISSDEDELALFTPPKKSLAKPKPKPKAKSKASSSSDPPDPKTTSKPNPTSHPSESAPATIPKPKPKPRPIRRPQTPERAEQPQPPAAESPDSLPHPSSLAFSFAATGVLTSQLPPSDPPPPTSTVAQSTPPVDGEPSPLVGAARKRKRVMAGAWLEDEDGDCRAFGAVSPPVAEGDAQGVPAPAPFFASSSSSGASGDADSPPRKKSKNSTDKSADKDTGKKKVKKKKDALAASNDQDPDAPKKKKKAKKGDVEVVIKAPPVRKRKGNEAEVFKSKEFIDDEDDEEDSLDLLRAPRESSPVARALSPAVSRVPSPPSCDLVASRSDNNEEPSAPPKKKAKKTNAKLAKLKSAAAPNSSSCLSSNDAPNATADGEALEDAPVVTKARRNGKAKVVLSEDEGEASSAAPSNRPTLAAIASPQPQEVPPVPLRSSIEVAGMVQDTENKLLGPAPSSSVTPARKPALASPARLGSIAPKPKATAMSELIRRANSIPGSPFGTSHTYSPYTKSSRAALSRIAPLHPNRRTPPPPLPRPPPPKKTKKQLEQEERWEEELSESVEGWACLADEERAALRRAKRDAELGYED